MGCAKSICVLFALSILFQICSAALPFNEYNCATSCTFNGGSFNEYYSGLSTYSSNTLYIRGIVPISAGALFYIIQMQDSICDWTDSSSYGTITYEGNTGYYELNTLQSSSYDGTNTYLVFENDLKYNYFYSDATGSRGQARFQAIYVPTCGYLSFAADPTVLPWNGEIGGVFVSVSQDFNLNGHTIDASAKGFRGGINYQDVQIGTKYNYVSYFSDVLQHNAYKAEGSCGTPSQIAGVTNGYPTGDLSRGAPANGGGGGNDVNSGGGGGGGAGGAGSQGGLTWSANQNVGGLPGRKPSFSTSSQYAYLGGGGGAGHSNDGSGHSYGLRGGGIIVIATDNVVSGGYLKVDGETPPTTYPTEIDGGGGGGGAGTVHLISRNSASSNRFNSILISATGGNGVVMEFSHGPGGGGGGGIVLSTDSINSGNVNLAAGTCSGPLCVASAGTAGQIVDSLQFTDFSMLYTCEVVNPTGGAGLSFINEIDCTSTCTLGYGNQFNTYWAGIATTSETSVSVAGYASYYPVGSLFYIIQMQDSICDSSNTGSYGSTSSNGESGHYEMNQLVATTYDSTNGITHLYFERNLQYNYQSGQKSSSAGQKRFQVVYVPNCGTITFYGNPYVPLWDGTKGGVFVSVSQYFNLNGYTISVNSAGFRGGYTFPTTTSFLSTTNYVGYYGDGYYYAYKGEGICGTFNYYGYGLSEAGYPNGDLGRGAPANAGGGGNNHNNGGGGGAGAGGRGGSAAYFHDDSSAYAGIGGATPSFSANPLYAFFGGGGGAGHNNDYYDYSYGLNGGGIILIATDNVLGAGTLDASGGSDSTYCHYTGDGGGGGGGGGTVMLISRNSLAGNRFSGFTILATGGNGFFVDPDHGSGGGGGGGIVLTTDNISSGNIFVNGGLCQGPRCIDAKGQDGYIVNLVGYSNFGFAYTCSSNLAVSNIPVAASQTASPTRSSTPAISVSSSRTPTKEAVASATKSATPPISKTPSVSLTATITPTNNQFSSTPTKTSSPTISDSQTKTITQSISKTISVTASPSRSNGSSKSPLASRTPDSSTTPTQTPTKTVSVPISVTPSGTPPVTPTHSLTPTASSSLSLGNTLSLSPTRTISDTPSVSRSHSSSPTQSKSESISRTPTKSITQTRSPSISQTNSITPSISISPTKTITPSKSPLPGPPSATPAASDSPSISVSFSVSKSRSPAPSISPSSTISQSESRIVDAPIAPSATKSTSISRTPSKSFSASSTISKSKSPTNSFSNTRTQSPNPQIDASESPVPSPSLSSSSFGAAAVTASPFGFISLSVTSSPSLSSSKTPSSFPSVSASNSPLPCSCNDNNVCTEDTCDSISGECRFIPITSGFIACDDGFACTSSDQCLFGECRGVQVTCDDNNDCTLDSCDPSTGNCANVPITSSNSNNEAEIIRCNSPPLGLVQVNPSSTRSSQPIYYVPPVEVVAPSRTPTTTIGTVAASVQPAPLEEEEIPANSSSSLFFSSIILVLFVALF